jgi:hypothetical protein
MLNNPITERQIPGEIARDSEFQAADQAHLNALDPHPIYLTQAEADARYQLALPVTIVQQHVSPPAQISILANTWFDLGFLNNVNSGNSDSLFAMSLYLQYISGGETFPHWQHAGAALIAPIWWKVSGAQLVKYIDMETHGGHVDYTLSFRLGFGQGNRMVQLYFPIALSARLVRATFIRLRY